MSRRGGLPRLPGRRQPSFPSSLIRLAFGFAAGCRPSAPALSARLHVTTALHANPLSVGLAAPSLARHRSYSVRPALPPPTAYEAIGPAPAGLGKLPICHQSMKPNPLLRPDPLNIPSALIFRGSMKTCFSALWNGPDVGGSMAARDPGFIEHFLTAGSTNWIFRQL